ncbi:MAG: hypothetical protein AUI50_06765 [Crenarchaeota archaeon 13_1_40CM_2_52_14]|nr:MAG: hypothetical protein AUI97_09455 [Crenarchaeota archaeon 13_1_40CM_3_52_17]OLD34354.1 MAG: hypothetical protein AUI50_06765 [Crenarchaeota archaeon 13_1_40CM_2_52_14]
MADSNGNTKLDPAPLIVITDDDCLRSPGTKKPATPLTAATITKLITKIDLLIPVVLITTSLLADIALGANY